MTGVDIQAHADAILGLLRAVPDLTVYPPEDPDDTGVIVPDGADPPYVAVYIRPGFGLAGRVADATTNAIFDITGHCVGGNDIAARAVAQMVVDTLLDVEPVIEGRQSRPIRYLDSPPARPDESTGRLVVDQVYLFRLETLPG
ncbi:hypothetical protein ACH4T9_31170 [Micromonospora sp. NPDC020750]|uniref:hypothetical protein n=1 Tax=unclassified Micromonospora TaxID=2617518 RepID=UPI00379F6E72